MCNKWFDDVFLASLFNRIGFKSAWLTQKQTAVCVQNMEKHTRRNLVDGINYWSQTYYTYQWQGRKVYLDYSKLNGCGTIQFEMNADESAQAQSINEAEKLATKIERIAKTKANKPERVAMRITELKKQITNINAEIADDIEDGVEPDLNLMAYLEEIKSELTLWLL